MKKKILSMFLTVVMLGSLLTGCSTKDPNGKSVSKEVTEQGTEKGTEKGTENKESSKDSQKDQGGLVGFAISYTGNDFMQGLADTVKKGFEEKGYECQVASADGDATTQIEQIENFVTMGADLVVVMAVDPTGLQDVGKRAMESGTAIVSFTTQIEGGETTYVGSASEFEIGQGIAQLGSDWIDKTFPEAAEGEIETVVFGYSGTPEAADRSDGIKESIEKNTKCKVTYMEPESNTLDAAQQAAENLFQTNPKTKLILSYNSGMSNGVNAYVMSGGSAVSDKATFATFGSDVSEEVMANIEASKNNESVVRGCVSLGDLESIWIDLYEPCQLILDGKEVEPAYLGEIQLISADKM